MAERPTAAFVLSLVGGVFYILGGAFIAFLATVVGSLASLVGAGYLGLGIVGLGTIGLVSGIVILVGAVMMNSSDKSKVRTGSILVLVFTLVGAAFTIGGFFIGFILALIGAILGLTWKPSATMPPPPSPPA